MCFNCFLWMLPNKKTFSSNINSPFLQPWQSFQAELQRVFCQRVEPSLFFFITIESSSCYFVKHIWQIQKQVVKYFTWAKVECCGGVSEDWVSLNLKFPFMMSSVFYFLGQYLELLLAAFSIAICCSFDKRKPLEEVNDNRKIPGERCGGAFLNIEAITPFGAAHAGFAQQCPA